MTPQLNLSNPTRSGKRLIVVTVNYCCAGAILEHLQPTAVQIAEAGGVWWIVDNNSPDNSVEVIGAACVGLDNVHLIASNKNGGFGYGNNQVIKRVIAGEIEADFLYFLNPDANPKTGAIPALLSYLEDRPNVGLVGSGLLNVDGTHTDAAFRFPSFQSEVESSIVFGPVTRLLKDHRLSLGEVQASGPVDWVAGTSFMARAELFRAIGGFDENFFLYWEEIDLCRRAKSAGFEVHTLPTAKVMHVGGVSTGMHRSDQRIPDFWHHSRNYYFSKTNSLGFLAILNAVTAVCIVVRRCLDLVLQRPKEHPHFLRDHVAHALHIGRL